jgi:cytochrome P450
MPDPKTRPVEATWDPSRPEFRANPYPYYDALRALDPISSSGPDTWVLTRYADVAATLRSAAFSRDVEASAKPSNDPVAQRRRQRRSGGAKTILTLDPPDHTRLRRLVTKAFTPSAIERLRPRIQTMVDTALDAAEGRGTIELIEDLAFPVPFQVISELLDMPTDRADEMRSWSQVLTASLEPDVDIETFDRADSVLGEMIPYLWEIIEQRRAHPGDDLLSALISVEEQGDRLDAAEMIAFVLLLYVAGHETTVNLIGNGMLALLNHPDQLEVWRQNPDLDEQAVDELLRYDGPVQHTVRIPLEPVSYEHLDGRTVNVEAGDTVLTVLGAANRDPAVFDDPHRLDLRRPNSHRHLAFASGIHYCLGASLARLEAAITIGSLIRRFGTIDLISEPTWRDRLTIRGVDRMDLELRPA